MSQVWDKYKKITLVNKDFAAQMKISALHVIASLSQPHNSKNFYCTTFV
jgi:hypothetical protein